MRTIFLKNYYFDYTYVAFKYRILFISQILNIKIKLLNKKCPTLHQAYLVRNRNINLKFISILKSSFLFSIINFTQLVLPKSLSHNKIKCGSSVRRNVFRHVSIHTNTSKQQTSIVIVCKNNTIAKFSQVLMGLKCRKKLIKPFYVHAIWSGVNRDRIKVRSHIEGIAAHNI